MAKPLGHGTDQPPARSVGQALNTRWSVLQPRWICQPAGNPAGCADRQQTFAQVQTLLKFTEGKALSHWRGAEAIRLRLAGQPNMR
jgi:hypothetical protein